MTASTSVALCTRQGERYLARQLDSISAQECLPDEVVISDDGSSDATLDIARAWARRAPFAVRVLDGPRCGVVANVTATLLACGGEVFFLSDQDDEWRPDRIARTLRSFDRPGTDAVFSDATLIDADGAVLPGTLWRRLGFHPPRSPSALVVRLAQRSSATGATMAMRATFVEGALPVPEGWVHDAWFALVASVQHALDAIPEPLIRYRLHDEQEIGVPAYKPFADRARSDRDPQRLRDDAERLRHVVERLDGDVAPVVDAIRHLELRAGLDTGANALLSVVREAIRGGYHRHAMGASSIARDVARSTRVRDRGR